jgi:hypothetical protein
VYKPIETNYHSNALKKRRGKGKGRGDINDLLPPSNTVLPPVAFTGASALNKSSIKAFTSFKGTMSS